MPRKKEVSVYKFSELKDRAKQRARDWYLQVALDYEWWENVYEDAANIGLVISGHDISRSPDADGKFTKRATSVAEAILKEHGNSTETYKDARDFLKDWKAKEAAYYKADEDNTDFEDTREAEDLEEEFLGFLLHDYAQILQTDYEWLISDEQVDEAIESNDYEFNEDGSRA